MRGGWLKKKVNYRDVGVLQNLNVRDEAPFKKPSLSHENLLNKTFFYTISRIFFLF